MTKLYKIKFIKDTELKKIGDIVNCSKKSAESAISNGYAKYYEGEITMGKFNIFHNGIANTIPNGEIDIKHFLELIKKDSPILEQIRNCQDKDQRDKLKSKLSYVTFAGTFEKRANDKIKESSGLACIDYDDIEDLTQIKQKLKNDEFTHCVFFSPSGKGLKLLVKIPFLENKNIKDKNNAYRGYWNSIAKHYKIKFDEAAKDISRACYLSYDPNPYFNPKSKVYTKTALNLLESTNELIKGEKDNSRSAFEFGKLCTLIKKKLTKETVFFEMNKYSKWASSPEQYKEHSYKKALVAVEKEKDQRKEKKAAEIFTRRGQANEFVSNQPVYYDNASIWWIWNKQEYKWEMSDEVDILNKIYSDMGVDTISSKSKTEIITSLKQVGRLKKPKEPKKTWIQFKSTIFDFSTGESFKATPDYLITNPLPYEIGESEDTPMITKLFDEWVGSEYTQTLYEILAYACSSDQSLQTIIALTGSGSNGKGTFLQLLTKFVGKDNVCSSELKTLALRNFETSALYKKLVCQMGEVDAYDLKNTNLIKQLTGEDLIRYEFKGKNPFSDYSATTCIIATNSLPVTPDKSIGFYRRWLIVDFPNQFKVVRNILGKIPEEEYNNLSKKILVILKQLYKKGSFTNGGDFQKRMDRYEERSNPIQKFIDEWCEDEPGEKVKLQDFSKAFNNYLKEKHLRLMTVRQIGKMLREEGFEVGTRTLQELDTKVSAKVVLNLKLKTTKTTKEKNTPHSIKNKEVFTANKKFSSSSVSGNSTTKTTKTTKLLTQPEKHISPKENGSTDNKGCLGIHSKKEQIDDQEIEELLEDFKQ